MRFGILMAAPPGRAPFRYRFNAQDALWLGRYLAAAGARARGRRRMLAWRAMQHFVDASGQVGSITFGEFVQRRAPSIPRAPWQALSPRTRSLALAATTGRLAPLPGNERIFVKPAGVSRGAYAPVGPRWGEYEEEYEAAPGETPPPGAPTDASPPPPNAKTNGVQPPTDAQNAPDAGAGPDGPPEGEPPPDEPAGPPADFNTADGNTLSLTPQLIQQLLATLRRHPRRYWMKKYPWLRQAFPTGGSGLQPWSGQPQWGGQQWGGQQWTGRGWTRPWTGQRPWSSTWSGQTWSGRPGVARPRYWRGRPLTATARVARPWHASRPIVKRMRQLARSSRKIGTLRSRRTGQRYPVFGARSGGRNYRIVTRPRRGGMQHEILLVHSGPLGAERQL